MSQAMFAVSEKMFSTTHETDFITILVKFVLYASLNSEFGS